MWGLVATSHSSRNFTEDGTKEGSSVVGRNRCGLKRENKNPLGALQDKVSRQVTWNVDAIRTWALRGEPEDSSISTEK